LSFFERREAAETLVDDYDLPVRRACLAVQISRSAWYREPQPAREDEDIRDALNKLVDRWPRWGFWKCFGWLRANGAAWNHKRVWRVYCLMKLNLPRRKKKFVLTRERKSLNVIPMPNKSWSLDFVHDALVCGKRFRTLNIIDEGVRECLAIEVDTSLPAARVVRVLEQIIAWRGCPDQIRMDNGPELISSQLVAWCDKHNIEMVHIQPGKPNQNAYIERFNRTYRQEVLNAYLFNSLNQVREITWQWIIDYNEQRPHDALDGLTPTAYREKIAA
jgi:putative transposase